MDYWILKPKGKRRSFTVICRPFRGKGIKTHALDDPRIEALNKLFKEGIQDFEACLKQLNELLIELRGKADGGAETLPANDQLALAFLNSRYLNRRHTKAQSKLSGKNAVWRAVRAMGALSLASASKDAIQDQIARLKPSQQRDRAKWINILLRFAGRDIRIELGRKSFKFNWLTLEQFTSIVPHLPNEAWKALAWTAFGTGARFGELFGNLVVNQSVGAVTIFEQRYKNWEQGETKNREQRTACIIPEALPWIQKWLNVPLEEKKQMRAEAQGYNKIKAACRKAGIVECTFHELRHGYAVHLRTRGMSTDHIAGFLGDSDAVTKEHYLRFGADDAIAASAFLKLKKP